MWKGWIANELKQANILPTIWANVMFGIQADLSSKCVWTWEGNPALPTLHRCSQPRVGLATQRLGPLGRRHLVADGGDRFKPTGRDTGTSGGIP